MKPIHKITLFASIAALVGFCLVVQKSDLLVDEKFLVLFNFYGTSASLLGLVLVLVQIVTIKHISKITKEAAEKTKDEITSFLFISDLSKSIKLVQEIQIYNRSKKFELSLIRMQELKISLLEVISNTNLLKLINLDSYRRLISNLAIDISSLEKEILYNSGTINILGLNKSLEGIHENLSDLNVRIKNSFGGCDD